MFSGIVEELGKVKNISRRSGNITLIEINAEKVTHGISVGDSIAVNGACLTVVANRAGILSFEVLPQTLKITNLGGLRILEKVNLERSLKVGDRISGHFVNGHIDCLGLIRQKRYIGGNPALEIAVPSNFLNYVVTKGSIALDGISLTIAEKTPSAFLVYIIPHTLKNTTLSFKGPSDKLNVEFDLLLKQQVAP